MNILFVCTGNTCRSSMAEGILKDLSDELNLNIKVKSAGTDVYCNGPANDKAVLVMKEMGIDISNHISKGITKELVTEADLILTMTHSHTDRIIQDFPEAISKTFTLKEYVCLLLQDKGKVEDKLYTFDLGEMNISDPFGLPVEEYRRAAVEIKEYINKFVELIKPNRK